VAGNICAVQRRDSILHSDISLLLAALNAKMELHSPDKEGPVELSVLEFLNVENAVNNAFGTDVGCRWLVKCIRCDLPKDGAAVRVARVSHRRENHPTMCSVAWRSDNSGTSNVYFTGPHYEDPERRALVLGHIRLETSTANPSAQLLTRQAAASLADMGLSREGERLVLHMCARVFGWDSRSDQQVTSLLEERKAACQVNNSQHFYVDPLLAPTTEPIIKPASYKHVSGRAMYTPDAPIPKVRSHSDSQELQQHNWRHHCMHVLYGLQLGESLCHTW